MTETSDCAHVRPVLAELATGAAIGQERAQALRHVAGCPICRQELAGLARVADDLLLLTPEREPPAGFEAAVVQRMVGAAPPARRPLRSWLRRPTGLPGLPGLPELRTRTGRRLVAAAVVAALAAGAGAVGTYWSGAGDRQLADRYRQTITAGRYPEPAPVTTATGTVVGHVFLYQGAPPWVMVALTAAPEPGDYTMVVVTRDGYRYPAGVCAVTGRTGTTGYPLPVPVAQIASIELTRPGIQLIVHPLPR